MTATITMWQKLGEEYLFNKFQFVELLTAAPYEVLRLHFWLAA